VFRRVTSTEAISKDFGLLILRLGIGVSIAVFHGYGKMSGGTERWESVGHNMENLGIAFAPVFWGFMAAFSEFVGSILLILGPLFRPATVLLGCTMLVAVTYHINLPVDNPSSGWSGASHAMELFVVCVALFFSGPGRFAFKLRRLK
jgi:putative oxidoreductase